MSDVCSWISDKCNIMKVKVLSAFPCLENLTLENINKFASKYKELFRLIEVFWVVVWIFFVFRSFGQVQEQIEQTNESIELVKLQMKADAYQTQTALEEAKEQNEIAESAYVKWKRFEEIRLLQEVSQYLETTPYDTIINDLRTKNDEMRQWKYTPYQIDRMLDVFIYLNYLIEENSFTEKDISVNFDWAIKVVCNSHYIMDPVDWVIQLKWKNSVKELCKKRKFTKYLK